jgi:hypothetical protein
MPDLVLGPLLRYINETQATAWVETDGPCEVEILGRRARLRIEKIVGGDWRNPGIETSLERELA